MIIDCDACAVRDVECGNCVVNVLIGMPSSAPAGGPPAAAATVRPAARPIGPTEEELDRELHRAISVLAEFGLVPPLRLVATEPAEDGRGATAPATGGRRAEPGRRRSATPPRRVAG